MKIGLIAAVGKRGQIGLNGDLPWYDKEDLQWFQDMTKGKILIAGYRTFHSLKHLDGTHGRSMICDSSSLLRDHLREVVGVNEVMIIGGAKTYAKWLPHVDRFYISRIEYDGPADTFFPMPVNDVFMLQPHTSH